MKNFVDMAKYIFDNTLITDRVRAVTNEVRFFFTYIRVIIDIEICGWHLQQSRLSSFCVISYPFPDNNIQSLLCYTTS